MLQVYVSRVLWRAEPFQTHELLSGGRELCAGDSSGVRTGTTGLPAMAE
jgi:hypothetical protein